MYETHKYLYSYKYFIEVNNSINTIILLELLNYKKFSYKELKC